MAVAASRERTWEHPPTAPVLRHAPGSGDGVELSRARPPLATEFGLGRRVGEGANEPLSSSTLAMRPSVGASVRHCEPGTKELFAAVVSGIGPSSDAASTEYRG